MVIFRISHSSADNATNYSASSVKSHYKPVIKDRMGTTKTITQTQIKLEAVKEVEDQLIRPQVLTSAVLIAKLEEILCLM